MTPELLAQIVQLGATGLLAVVLYFGLQANSRMLEILADALKSCMERHAALVEKIAAKSDDDTP